MILVLGPVASGKRTFAKSLGFDENTFEDGVVGEAPVTVNLQDVVKATLKAGGSIDELAPLLADKELVACTEVGAGIVPMTPEEREWREQVGRLCNILVPQALAVVRMVCGIPVYLKGEPCG